MRWRETLPRFRGCLRWKRRRASLQQLRGCDGGKRYRVSADVCGGSAAALPSSNCAAAFPSSIFNYT
ncbi:MAG: hypothetical protein GVY10_01085 [Verrucomicrobia bacterium]|nr:hypothetical protein [Verrucomicrobiota bacterium]